MINDKGNPNKEVRKRVSECMCIMKKLDCFWKHTNNPQKWKLITYNAIIKKKLMYGLESAQLNDSIKKYLDTFHLKCLRKILNLEHTYLERENTNEKIYQDAENEMNIGNTGERKPLIKLSEYYDTQRRKTISQIIHHKETEDPRISITFNKDTLQINEYNTKRVGRPKFAWWIFALDDLWLSYQKTSETHRYTPMNLDNPEHIEIIKQTAAKNYEEQEKKKKKKNNTTATTTPTAIDRQMQQNNEQNTNQNQTFNTFRYSHTIEMKNTETHYIQTTHGNSIAIHRQKTPPNMSQLS